MLIDSLGIAAAASTLAYRIAYDIAEDDKREDPSNDKERAKEVTLSSELEYVVPERLAFSDNNKVLNFEPNLDNELEFPIMQIKLYDNVQS